MAPQWNMWLRRKVMGDSLANIIRRPQGQEIARRVGQALRKVHCAELRTVRSHSIADEYAILDDQLRNLAQQTPRLAGRLRRLTDSCFRLARSMRPLPTTGIHRDFYPEQVRWLADGFIYSTSICLRTAIRRFDAGNFIGHLTEQSVRELGDPDALSEREIAIEDEFLAYHGEQSRSTVRAFATSSAAGSWPSAIDFQSGGPLPSDCSIYAPGPDRRRAGCSRSRDDRSCPLF